VKAEDGETIKGNDGRVTVMRVTVMPYQPDPEVAALSWTMLW
jgi:hypothetical protein